MKAKAARWALYALALTFFSAATATAAPGVATDVRASQGRFADRIEISWTAAPGAQVYRVYRSSEEQPDLRVMLGAWQAETRFVDRTVVAGVRYFYWIKASDGAQSSAFGESGSGYLQVDRLDGATARVLLRSDASGVRLVWDEVLGAGFYRVYRGVRADTAAAVPISDWLHGAEFRDVEAAPGRNMYYWVKSAFGPRGSGASGFGPVVRGRRALAAPAGLVVEVGRAAAVSLVWDETPGAKFYQVYRSEQPYTATAQPISGWIGGAEFSDRKAVPGKHYSYWIKASTSPYPGEASAFSVPATGRRRLSQPTGVAIAAVAGAVQLRWDEVEGARAYRVFRGTSSYPQEAEPVSEWGEAAEFADARAEPGVRYHYWIKAALSRSGGQQSAFSQVVEGLVALAAPRAPAVNSTGGRVDLEWEPVAGGSHYQVYRGERADGSDAVALSPWQTRTDFVDGQTVPGVRYYYWVKAAKGAHGQMAGVLGARATSFWAMAAPATNEASQGLFGDRVELSWSEVDGASYYRVYRSTSPDPVFRMPLGAWQPVTEYRDDSVQAGVRYYYWIKAAPRSDGQGASGYSPISSGFLGDTVLPAPAQLTATDGEFDDRVDIAWPTVIGGSHYRLYRSEQADPTTARALSDWQVDTVFADREVVPGTVYYYWVKVATDARGGKASDLGSVNSGYRALVAPSAVQATVGSLGEVEVSWGPSEGAGFFRVYRSTSANSVGARALSGWQSDVRYVDRTAAPGTIYYYWIKASPRDNGFNASDFGVAASGYRALAAPAGLTLQGMTSQVRLVWDPVAGATHYQVLRATVADPQRAAPLSGWQRAASFADRTAAPGVTYYYWVQGAVDAMGSRTSAASAPQDEYRRVAAPEIADASQGDEAQVAISWAPVDGASHYRILRGVVPNSAAAQVVGDWQAASEFTDADAIPGATYFYWVEAAVDAVGGRASALSTQRDGYRGLAPVEPQIIASDEQRVDLGWPAVAGAAVYRVFRSEQPDARQAAPISVWQTATDFTDNGALPGVTYYYWVRAAADDQGLNAAVFGGSASGYRVLQNAGGLSATRGELAGVDLAWSEVSGATHYRIYRGVSADPAASAPLGAWVPSVRYSDDTAAPGVTYHYWVRSATSALGHKAGPFGQAAQGFRGLAVPGLLLSSTGDPDNISVGWQPVVGATHYQVYRTRDLENELAAPISSWQTELLFTDSDTEPGQTYHYWVRAAVDAAGGNASRFSEVSVGYRGLLAPAPPQVTSHRLGEVWLEWPAVPGASRYRIYRGTGASLQDAELLTGWLAGREYADVDAEPGVVYHYRIQAAVAADGSNSSVPSPVVSGFRGLEPPAVLAATTGEAGRVELSWDAVPGASYYRILRATADDPAGATSTSWQQELAHTDTDVEPGITYYYWVQATTDLEGVIASQLSAGVRGYETLVAPANLQIEPAGNAIALNWDANSEFDLMRYRIYVGADSTSLTLADSVAATDPTELLVRSILPLPSSFNLGDMGLSVLDSRDAINARFVALVGRDATAAELDELFSGRKLERASVAPLSPHSNYYFEISAVNAQGREGVRVRGRVLSVETVGLEVVDGDGRVDISWAPVWGAAAYRIYRHTDDNPQAAVPVGDWQQATTLVDGSAQRGRTYYYWLRTAATLDELVPGPFSRMATGSRRVAAPPLVSATRDLADRVRLEWHAGEGAEAFRVYHHRTNDPATAAPISAWLEDNSFEHLTAPPGENYYWIKAASDTAGDHASPLSAVSTGVRTTPLAVPTDIEASWGAYKDRVMITWQRELAATHVKLYYHTSDDVAQAVPLTDWVTWNGYEHLQAAPDQVHYYWVRAATSAEGDHATELSAFGRGFRSGELFAPTGLATATTPGKIFLSWEPNPEADVARYRVYAGTDPDGLALIDSVQADDDPRIIVRDVVPLPDPFNLVDMGLGIESNWNQIYDRFEELFGLRPAVEWVDELFAGGALAKTGIIGLEAGRTYYFKVAAVDEAARVSMLSQSAEVLALAGEAGKVVATAGDIPAATGLSQNAPNPFNAETLVRFQLSAAGAVRVRLYNALGQLVADLVDGAFAAGHYAVGWDGRDRNGYAVGSGLYFCVLETEQGAWKRRMTLLR
ncbi:MAG: hypothetical protein CME20_15100 [Gemmatimonadetes bacterium]|nr:hypothetical protein [Gemmatimonadota bacterium]